MYRINRLHSVACFARRALQRTNYPESFATRASPRCLHTQYEDKYSEKLRKVAEEQGLSVSELKAKIKLEQERQRRDVASTRSETPQEGSVESGRKDSSPVKPLSSILNIPRILASPHTVEQIEALWTVYHTSRSNGTGRGYLCACIPLDVYTKMASKAAKYPICSPRILFPSMGVSRRTPDSLSTDGDLFTPPPAEKPALSGTNPQISTVMFTPLQEYKMRGSFATPYLVLTNYTDLAHSHGVVLLRGEITPSAATGGTGVDGRYMLQQEDAPAVIHEHPEFLSGQRR
ncbi:Protein ATP11, mitochondrial [Mycena sanguinolenta]|uniref:Protein ATP11, mitochondrial n=1 Tax=Mycena sanguinolenta TaxID=230812 RepID=A0A8H7DAG8_9AGAR|nr:Protein ATP11, mitochondrial [Mycena sanguinolenta]